MRKLGDSNSWYDNSHGSLANCWFQPLTQTSNFVSAKTLFVKSSAKVGFLFQLAKQGVPFFELAGKKIRQNRVGGMGDAEMGRPCCLSEKIYAETGKTTSDIIFPTSDVVFSMSDVVSQTIILYNRGCALAGATVY